MKPRQLDFPSTAALEVQARFEHWRNNRSKRGKIPAELWSAAAKLTKHHSINQVAKLMRLNATDLSKKVSVVPVVEPYQEQPVSFIEFPKISDCKSDSCKIELKRSDGSQMQIRLSRASSTDISALIQAFVN